jgi:recombination DNA repair RAD52 pathway protein
MTQAVAQFNPDHGFSDEQIDALKCVLHEDQIRERKGGGKMLKYIKADMAVDTANRIFGFGQWGYKVVSRGHMIIEDPKKGKIEMYTADVELSVVGAAFPFPGGGVGIVNDPYTVEMHEKAYKEAETDAMKRALRHYGDQFGLSLYNEDDPIEGRDGTIKPVKAADVRNHPVPERRVVESNAPRALSPVSASNAPTPGQLREQCNTLLPGKWEEVIIRVVGSNIPDDTLTPKQCAKIYEQLNIVEQRRRKAHPVEAAS